jgi:hypothetical protein
VQNSRHIVQNSKEQSGIAAEEKTPDKDRPPENEQRETHNEADAALREAREKAEIERVPGGRGESSAGKAEQAGEEQTGILDDDPLYDSEVIGEDEEIGVIEQD